ncbi:hypothetical protein, conserved [Trypanosoma brucei brucei TREU927]|uniref:Uncharacterized protein n=1 Tax=Trypanosoma brucei brucei (strain 927/4 GUTat10.1) TaxID=185431 RepID=Q38DR0_TRYB2|nr:hypothetical protein, conserved [Trypanosoma brucei brucei TREU927]EAN77060.1 hypothetical protein, conserved [Trypanosoma brucei brucei TREU927]
MLHEGLVNDIMSYHFIAVNPPTPCLGGPSLLHVYFKSPLLILGFLIRLFIFCASPFARTAGFRVVEFVAVVILSMGVDKKISSLEDFFKRVSFPLQPLHYETKLVLDTFLDKGGFLNICDMTFGSPFHDGRRSGAGELSWMDVANSNPNGKTALALFRFLAPGGYFCYLLEALSLPQHDFAVKLKKSWKGDAETEIETGSYLRYFDFPFSTFHPTFHELFEEAPEANLFDLPRSRCPPLMLVPFWAPPLVTRLEPSSRRVLTSLRCSPISYFILRMLLYGVRRTEECCSDVVRLPRINAMGGKINVFFKAVVRLFKGSYITGLPLYHRLLTAYIQYFVSSTCIQKLSSKRSFGDIQWSVSDVTAALLLSAPSHLWARSVSKVDREKHRLSCRDVASAALVFRLVPFLTECLFALCQKDRGRIYTSCWEGDNAVRKDFCDSHITPAVWDVLNPHISFYRNTLSVLRQALISFENYDDCRREHFNNALELWYAVVSPTGRVDDVSESYVVHHYEAYSFILFDVILMFLRSSFLEAIDVTGATIWSRCVEVFTSTAVQNVFREVSNATTNARCGIIETICRYFTLNWMGEDGIVRIMKPHAEETLHFLAEVYLATEVRLGEDGISDDTKCSLRLSLDYLAKSFDGIIRVVDERRSSRVSRLTAATSASSRPSGEGEYTDRVGDSKDLYFRGTRMSCKFSGPVDVRFNAENEGIPFYAQSSNAGFSDEFPHLVTLTEWMETALVFVFELYYKSWIPQCSNGHKLWLLSSDKHCCVNHPQQSAIWECFLCEEVYGSCCRSKPRCPRGGSLTRTEISQSISFPYCNQCFVMFKLGSVAYNKPQSDTLFCSNCASRPFKRISCRFFASHIVVVLCIIVSLMVFLFFTI